MTGMDESQLMADAKGPAERQVRMSLTVAALIKAENLEVTDEEVEAEYTKLAEQYSMDVEMVKKYLPAEQVKDQLLDQKAIAVVVENATEIKTEKKSTKKAAKKEEEAVEGEEKPAKKTTKKTSKKAEEKDAE